VTKREVKTWHEEVRSYAEFTDGNNKLILFSTLYYEGGSVNAKLRSVLEFTGVCETENGNLVVRRKRYDITPEIAATIAEGLQALEPYEKGRSPKIGRERFRVVEGGFVLSLKQTPDKTFFTLQQADDGWKFETEKRDEFFGAFSDATSF
jgi:hypothetical protein